MGRGSWRYILGGLGLVEVYFKWLEVCRHLLWVGGGRWRYVLGGMGWMDIFMGGWG